MWMYIEGRTSPLIHRDAPHTISANQHPITIIIVTSPPSRLLLDMPPLTPPPTAGKVTKQRHSKSCKRCTRRKQRCHGFPVCRACEEARVPCKPSAYAMQLYGETGGSGSSSSGSGISGNSAAFQRIQVLETQLARALAELAAVRQQQQSQRQEQTPQPQPTPQYADPKPLPPQPRHATVV
jgi:hypothetical protein